MNPVNLKMLTEKNQVAGQRPHRETNGNPKPPLRDSKRIRPVNHNLNLSQPIALRTPHRLIPLKVRDARSMAIFTADPPEVRSRCIHAVKMA
jgi:hypothetical protein